MTMHGGPPPCGSPSGAAIAFARHRLPPAGLLVVVAALLVSCGSSGNGLIPTGNAGPLQSDFEAVARAARAGDGSCTATETAIANTERDFAALPSTVDQALRNRLHEGISKLHDDALNLCAQPLVQTTTTGTSPGTTTSTQTTSTTPTVTQPTTTQTAPTTSTPTTSGPGGGTPAQEEGQPEPGKGRGGGGEPGSSGGAPPASGKEGGK
jgi:hypothetical protein